jgi:hypothetical protein
MRGAHLCEAFDQSMIGQRHFRTLPRFKSGASPMPNSATLRQERPILMISDAVIIVPSILQ